MRQLAASRRRSSVSVGMPGNVHRPYAPHKAGAMIRAVAPRRADELRKETAMAITRKNIQPETLAAPTRAGHTLYSHVVTVDSGQLIFVSGQRARDRAGNVVGKG